MTEKVLIVDGNINDLKLLEVILKGNGYGVVKATNGWEALEQLKNENFIAIVSDILMPIVDGFQLCQSVKANKKLMEIPFIFYTATYTDDSDEDLALRIGAKKFIRKPQEPDEFMRVLNEALANNETETKINSYPKVQEEVILKLYNKSLMGMLEKKMLCLEQEIGVREQAESEFKKSHDQLRQLLAHLEKVREEERAHIAREIHDELGQVLAFLKLDLFLLIEEVPQDGGSAKKKIQSIITTVDESIRRVQSITEGLRPHILDLLDLEEAIRSQAREFQEKTGIHTDFQSMVQGIEWDPDISNIVFRVYQETLTNVARHSESKNVCIELSTERNNLVLSIHDDGKGIARNKIFSPKSLGLSGMRERARIWGGQVTILSIKNKGTTVTLKLSIKKHKNNPVLFGKFF